MMDIIARLRMEAITNWSPVLKAAQDEIEFLRAENERLLAQRDEASRGYDRVWRELASS
jgi:hypothetical protein